MVIDAASFHKIEEVMRSLKEQGVTLGHIPAGCVSLLQPLDTAVNKTFKQWLQDATDEYVE